jgi:hypothetical protein
MAALVNPMGGEGHSTLEKYSFLSKDKCVAKRLRWNEQVIKATKIIEVLVMTNTTNLDNKRAPTVHEAQT